MGGKWTTYRIMAQDTIDVCCQRLGVQKQSKTDELILLGGDGYGPTFINSLTARHPAINPQTIRHLSETYGTQAAAVLALMEQNPSLAELLVNHHPFVKAEVVYAAQAEMALTLEYLLIRRIRLGLVDWQAALQATPVAAALLGAELGWSPEYQQEQQNAYTNLIQQHIDRAGLSANRRESMASA
jgi:glycerol-3-phosphate dehydrogenase